MIYVTIFLFVYCMYKNVVNNNNDDNLNVLSLCFSWKLKCMVIWTRPIILFIAFD